MHNLAIDMHSRGVFVSGSDDEIFEPARSRLAAFGLLPASEGWHPEKISRELDAVILGMHARMDNPELIRCLELGIKVYSFPEYLYEQTRDKLRVVVGGSHGKTTITSMIMHVLKEAGIVFDYLVGAQVQGFDTMVSVKETSKLAVFEGDEYLSSAIDPRPKFHLYKPHIAVISGIAWDHMNVFPTIENYTDQFRKFIRLVEEGGSIIYYEGDCLLADLVETSKRKIKKIPYNGHPSVVRDGTTYLLHGKGKTAIKLFGRHNLLNIDAALHVCRELGVTDRLFYRAIGTFTGAARRLQLLSQSRITAVYYDFAHAPSKLRATVGAVKEQFPHRGLTACIELHTFSSLNREFLPQYAGCMDQAEEAVVFFNPETLTHKRLPTLPPDDLRKAFARDDLRVFNNAEALREHLLSSGWENRNLLLMSSGNLGGIDVHELAEKITGKVRGRRKR